MDQAQRDRMAAMSGDTGRGKFPTFNVPELRFDGNTGEFKRITKNEDRSTSDEPVNEDVNVVVLKKRRTLKAFKDDDSWFTTEFSSPADKVTLFHSIAGSTETLMTATPAELRAKYPQLKTQEVLYVLFNDSVCKINVRGGSSANYYDFQTKMRDEDKHSFEYTLKIGSEEAERVMGKQKKKYFRMTFSAWELTVANDVIESKMVEVDAALKKIDDYEASVRGTVRSTDDGWTAGATETNDEPSPEDIPF